MDQLLKEFWEAFKRWERYKRDRTQYHVHEACALTINSAWYEVKKIARRIELLEISERNRQRIGTPRVADVPGQTFIADLIEGKAA